MKQGITFAGIKLLKLCTNQCFVFRIHNYFVFCSNGNEFNQNT